MECSFVITHYCLTFSRPLGLKELLPRGHNKKFKMCVLNTVFLSWLGRKVLVLQVHNRMVGSF